MRDPRSLVAVLLAVCVCDTGAGLAARNRWSIGEDEQISDVGGKREIKPVDANYAVSSPSREGEVRLVGGRPPASGRVEVYHDGQWGTICKDLFDESAASVVCRRLGFFSGRLLTITPTIDGEEVPIWLDDVTCLGSEDSVVDCYHGEWGVNNCNHEEDVAVKCSFSGPNGPEEGDIRLKDGPTSYSGRVEIYHDRSWGTVCDDGFRGNEADVVCKYLGYEGGDAYPGAHFGRGDGQIWLDQLTCTGDELELSDCDHAEWGVTNCHHREDVAVECFYLSVPDSQ